MARIVFSLIFSKKKFIEFLRPERSKWIDVGICDISGRYKLIQMRIQLNNNKKTFRVKEIGYINDFAIKQELYKNILAKHSDDI